MAIKQQHPLTKEDFETALVTLRLSVSEVARETGIPRHIVSHFRNYGDGLKPEQAAKLRDWLEDKGVEFADEEETPATPQQADEQPAGQEPFRLPITLSDEGLTQRTAVALRHFFIDERLTVAQLKEAGDRVEECFSKAQGLLGVNLVQAWGEYDDATDAKLRELWGYLARIGLVCLHIQGRVMVDQDRIQAGLLPDDARPAPKTFRDLLTDAYRDVVAGLNVDSQAAQAEAEEEEVTA